MKKVLFFLSLAAMCIGLYGELILQTEMRNQYGAYRSPAYWLLYSLLFCAGAFYHLRKDSALTLPVGSFRFPLRKIITAVVFLGLAAWGATKMLPIYATYPITPEQSDIIPNLELYVRRMLAGEFPYTPMVFETWTVLPTYFPMMWLPYTFSELLHIDYRWTAYLGFLLVLAVWMWTLLRRNTQTLPEILLKLGLPFLLLSYFFDYEPKVFGHAVELLPIAYYWILCLGLMNKNRLWFFALGIVCCLLSRYAFSFWLPLTLVIFWIEYGFRKTLRLGLWCIGGVLLLYVIPFLAQDWSILTDGLAYYKTTAIRQWSIQGWQQVGEKPYHLFQGLSFSGWFYNNTPGTALDKMSAARAAHAIVSFAAAAALAAGYFLIKKYRLTTDIRLYLMIGLKFYLTWFYGFIYVPFGYLFMVPLFIGVAIVFEISFIGVNNKSGVE